MDDRSEFNRVVMTKARYVAPAGETTSITLGKFDPAIHKNHLSCLFCEAGVYFHSGTHSKDGDNSLQSRHFHTKPNQRHDAGCEYGLQLARRPENREYDKTIGYRFNLDMGAISGIHERGHIKRRFNELGRLWSPDVYAREPVPIRGAQSFADDFAKLDIGRIKDSVVLWHKHQVPWDQFFVKHGQLPALVDSLTDPEIAHPFMLYVHPQKQIGSGRHGASDIACAGFRHPELGTVDVRLSFADQQLSDSVSMGKPLLVICRPHLFQGDRKNILYVNVENAADMAACDIKEVLSRRSDISPAPQI